MQVELCALIDNITWTMVPFPPSHHPIICKWIFKIKYHFDGTVKHYKAQVVVKGFMQHQGIGYKKTFTSIAKLIIVYCILTVVIDQN